MTVQHDPNNHKVGRAIFFPVFSKLHVLRGVVCRNSTKNDGKILFCCGIFLDIKA